MPVRFSGQRLRQCRQRAGLSLDQLSVALGGPGSITLRAYEHERRRPKLTTLCRMAELLGCTITDFFIEANDEPRSIVRIVR